MNELGKEINVARWWEKAAQKGYFKTHHQFESAFEIPTYIKMFDLNRKSRILEIGPGGGRDTRVFAATSDYVCAIDIGETITRELKEHLPQVDCKTYDGEHIPYPDNSFDFVYAAFVFQHNSKRVMKALLLEVNRVLKKEGTTMLEFPGNFNIVEDEEDFIQPGKATPRELYSTGFTFDQLLHLISNLGLSWKNIFVRNQAWHSKDCVNFWVQLLKIEFKETK